MPTQKPNRWKAWDVTFWSLAEWSDDAWFKKHAADPEERRVFELNIERMISESVPADLEALRRAYDACDWSIPPLNSVVTDVRESIVASFYTEDNLDADQVLGHMRDIDTVDPDTKRILKKRPSAVLGFPKERLETFLRNSSTVPSSQSLP